MASWNRCLEGIQEDMGTIYDAKDPPWQPPPPSLLPFSTSGAAFPSDRLARLSAPLSPVAELVSISGVSMNRSPPRFGESGSSFPDCIESDHTPFIGSGSQSVRNLDALVDNLPSSISSDVAQGRRACKHGTESSGVNRPSLTVGSLQEEVKVLPAARATGDFFAGMSWESNQVSHSACMHKGSPVIGDVVDVNASETSQCTPTRPVDDLEDGELEEGQLLGECSPGNAADTEDPECYPTLSSYVTELDGQKGRDNQPMEEPGKVEGDSKVDLLGKSKSSSPSGGDISSSKLLVEQSRAYPSKLKSPRSPRRKLKSKTSSSSKHMVKKEPRKQDSRPIQELKAATVCRKSLLKTDEVKLCKSKPESTRDDGPEEGEVLPEKGALSALIEDEVGLWTTDVADEEIEQVDEQRDGKAKRGNGPQRKLAKKASYRRKKAEKEKQLGLRPSKRVKLSEPPPPPPRKLCMFFLKGRCAKGKDCSFSHDCVPLTKSEPCKFLTMGCCLKGHDCPFSHDLALFPCKYFHTRGYCFDAENCRFSHGPISEEERKKLLKRLDQESKDRHQTKDGSPAECQISTAGPDLPPGYDSLGTQDIPPVPMEVDGGQRLHSNGSEPVTASLDEGGSRSMLFSSPEIVSGNAGKTATVEDRRLEVTECASPVDQKEGENFVLLAARKAAAAAVAAGQKSEVDARGSTKTSFNSSLRRSRGLEGSAMEILKATMMSKEEPAISKLDTPISTTNYAGGSKFSSAMALLEGILKGD